MKRLFVLALAAVAASACGVRAVGGRAYSFNFFPTVDVVVVNNCAASTIYVKPPRGNEVAIRFGDVATISLERYLGNDPQMILVARGVGYEGSYLGSVVRTFTTGTNGRRESFWTVDYLRGGIRSCRQR